MSDILSTEISNRTNYTLKVQRGSSRNASHLATIEASKKIKMQVDRNATYHEYTVGVAEDPAPQNLVFSSDDLCDSMCITIDEESGELKMKNVSRTTALTSAATSDTSNPPKKTSWLPSWMSK